MALIPNLDEYEPPAVSYSIANLMRVLMRVQTLENRLADDRRPMAENVRASFECELQAKRERVAVWRKRIPGRPRTTNKRCPPPTERVH